MQQNVRKKKKTCFNAHFQYSQSKTTGLNKMRSLKSLAMLRCESRTSLHQLLVYMQHNINDNQVLFCFFYCFKNAWPRPFALIFCGTVSLDLFLAFS